MSDWERPIEVLSSNGVKELRRLQAENAKLRELVTRIWRTARLMDANEHIDGMRITDEFRASCVAAFAELGGGGMRADNLFLIGRDKDGGEWVMAVQDRPKDLDGFRELARERLAVSEKFIAVEIHEHTSRLVEVVS